MDFSFVSAGNSHKRKAADDAEQSTRNPTPPVASASPQASQATARPLVQLPSLQQVQAAQRTQSGPSLFQPSTAAASSAHQNGAVLGNSNNSWANTNRPDVSVSRAPSLASQGSGVFAQNANSMLRQSAPATAAAPAQHQHAPSRSTQMPSL